MEVRRSLDTVEKRRFWANVERAVEQLKANYSISDLIELSSALEKNYHCSRGIVCQEKNSLVN